MAHSRSVLANQKARNAIVGAENLLSLIEPSLEKWKLLKNNCNSGFYAGFIWT